jgi:hypothetical protein
MQVLRGIYRSRRSRHKDPGRYPLVFQDIHHHYCPGHGGALGSAAYLVAATHLTRPWKIGLTAVIVVLSWMLLQLTIESINTLRDYYQILNEI